MKIVFDTYAWIEFFKGTDNGKIVKKYLAEGKVFTPSVVLLELSYKADREGWDFQKHLNFIKLNSEIVGLNENFILNFGKVYNKTRKNVRDMGIVDVVVLNTAIINDSQILTGDKHFEKIERSIIF